MTDLSQGSSNVVDAAAGKIGLGAAGVGIGAANYLEIIEAAQLGLAGVASIAGSILVIWGLIDKIRSKFRKSRRSTDKRETDA